MKRSSDIKLVVLEGDPRKRGQIHGKTLKSMILKGIELWKHNLQKFTGVNTDKYIDQFVKETNLLAAVKKWTLHLLEEVSGIGEGAGVDFNTIFSWQCLDEEWWYRVFEKKQGIDALGLGNCSALGCFEKGDGPPLLAQNLDLPNYYDGLQVLLHIKHSDLFLESFVFTTAGIIGWNGLNNQSLGLCVNTLLDLNCSPDGLPVAFVVRGILEQLTLKDVIEFVHKIKHASGQNYIIGDTEKIVDFECSANKVCTYIPYEGARRIYHTNHAIVNDDKRLPANEVARKSTTRARFNFLRKQLKDSSKSITVEVIKSILSSHEGSICIHNAHQPGRLHTFGSLIMSLSTPSELHLAPGPPCSNEWRLYKLTHSWKHLNCNDF